MHQTRRLYRTFCRLTPPPAHRYFQRDQGTLATTEMNDTNEIDNLIEQEETPVDDPDAEYGNVDDLRIMTSVTTPVYASKRNEKDGADRSAVSRRSYVMSPTTLRYY